MQAKLPRRDEAQSDGLDQKAMLRRVWRFKKLEDLKRRFPGKSGLAERKAEAANRAIGLGEMDQIWKKGPERGERERGQRKNRDYLMRTTSLPVT